MKTESKSEKFFWPCKISISKIHYSLQRFLSVNNKIFLTWSSKIVIQKLIVYVLISIFILSLNFLTTALAQETDIISFQILSSVPNALEIKIDYYYNGSYGPAWLSVVPTSNGIDTKNFYYHGGTCSPNNSVKVGHNSSCIGISIANGRQLVQFSTDAIEICIFAGIGAPRKYCESFYINKQWTSGQ